MEGSTQILVDLSGRKCTARESGGVVCVSSGVKIHMNWGRIEEWLFTCRVGIFNGLVCGVGEMQYMLIACQISLMVIHLSISLVLCVVCIIDRHTGRHQYYALNAFHMLLVGFLWGCGTSPR